MNFAGPELLALANSEPARALTVCQELLAGTLSAADRSIVLRAKGLALREGESLDDAHRTLSEAVDTARQAERADLAGLALVSLAAVDVRRGDLELARSHLGDADPLLTGTDRIELHFQGAVVASYAGDYRSARSSYTDAIEQYRAEGDEISHADALMNRALTHAYSGDIEDAITDLGVARTIFDDHNVLEGVALCDHNEAWMHSLRGAAVTSMIGFDAAQRKLTAIGYKDASLDADRCEVLLGLGRAREALEVVELALGDLDADGYAVDAASLQLVAGRAALMLGQSTTGIGWLRAALAVFTAAGHRSRSAETELHILLGELQQDGPSDHLLHQARALRQRVSEAGLDEHMVRASLVVAAVLLEAEQPNEALAILRPLETDFLDRGDRAELIRLTAAALRSIGEPEAAVAATSDGLNQLLDLEPGVRTTEIAASMTVLTAPIDALRVEALIDLERWDALGTMRSQPFTGAHTPPPAPELQMLAQHRALATAISMGGPDAEAARTTQRQLEHELRRRRMARVTNDSAPDPTGKPMRADLVLRDGMSRSLVVDTNRDDAPLVIDRESLVSIIRHLSLALELAINGTSDAWNQRVDDLSERLDKILGRPGQGNLDVVTIHLDATLPAIPWSLLPSMTGQTWVQVGHAPRDSKSGTAHGSLLVAGPRLTSSQDEVASLHDLVEGATTAGPDATVNDVLAAMNDRSVVHIAAHASLDSDNPSFSSIELADGAMTLHDLERLTHPPALVVLATCVGARGVPVGSTTVGFSNALLDLGIGAVVGSCCRLPDDNTTTSVMRRLHVNDVRNNPGQAIQTTIAQSSAARENLIARSLVCATAADPHATTA